ncbi:MAG: hypothetical protein PHU63_04180 [Candidatus ainarchaeum sp.]|nr:hypothetical protein [Candidatus ainarchaeum sp.]
MYHESYGFFYESILNEKPQLKEKSLEKEVINPNKQELGFDGPMDLGEEDEIFYGP